MVSDQKKKIGRTMLLLFGLGVLVLCVHVGWRWWNGSSSSRTVGQTLSARANEYVQSRRGLGSTIWNEMNFATKSAQVLGKTTFATSCFAITLPWPVVELRREDSEDTCVFRGKGSENGAQVTLTEEKFTGRIQEYPGVMIRQRQTQTYQQQTPKQIRSGETLMFVTADSTVLFWHVDDRMRIITISGGRASDRAPAVLEDVAQSL